MKIICSICKEEITDNSRSCKNCGTQVEHQKTGSPGTEVIKALQIPSQEGKLFAGRYKILSTLGQGGMGIVYKALDSKLDRIIALKFLPPEMSRDDEAKKRFIYEAKAAASLDHSNICLVHEIDETEDGQMFIAMGFYEGKTLKDKIASKPLPLADAINTALQIAEGLNIAHKKEIVHRDIKSANIIITGEGVVKILDFGLAKLKGQTKLTKEGTTVGTAAYMSPEQASGGNVDHRSDIWSLGVILYEMLTGLLPFRGEYERAIMYSIINKEPEPVTGLRTGVPVELERIINKTLAKDPEERYQNLTDLLVDLKAIKKVLDSETEILSTPSAKSKKFESEKILKRLTIGLPIVAIATIAIFFMVFQWQPQPDNIKIEKKQLEDLEEPQPEVERKMIVVLPFENLGLPEDEYFADGITEEITARLARLKDLGVISRLSASQYKSTDKSPRVIGQELGVDFLLRGTIRWQKSADRSNRVRITPQLIRISDDTHLWADVFEKELIDIFEIQASIAEQVASALDVTLLDGQRESLAVPPTENMEAYNYYLRGKALVGRDDLEPTYGEALQMYQKAIELDPEFAEVWAHISIAHSTMYWYNYDRTEQRVAKAKEAVDRAFALSPNLPEAYLAMGQYYYHCKLDYQNALEQFKKAGAGLGENSNLYLSIGAVNRRQGLMKEAAEYLTNAFELDPRSWHSAFNLAQTKMLLRNYQEAELFFDTAISLDQSNPWSYAYKVLNVLLWKGDMIRAHRILEEAYKRIRILEDHRLVRYEILLHLCNGKYQEALERLSTISDESINYQFYYIPKELFTAQIYNLMKLSGLPRRDYENARRFLEDRIERIPNDSRLHSSLGIAYAGLGMKKKAEREGKLAIELMPINKEAFRGFFRVEDLAQIYAIVGEHDKAIDQIEYLLSIPTYISIQLLRIDPKWNPLRKHPRFQRLLREGKQFVGGR